MRSAKSRARTIAKLSQPLGQPMGRAHDVTDPCRQFADSAAVALGNVGPGPAALIVVDDPVNRTAAQVRNTSEGGILPITHAQLLPFPIDYFRAQTQLIG